MLFRYGVKNSMNLESTKEKVKETNLEKYGCENAHQNETIKEKDGQLDKLKNDNESNEDLKKTIQDLQKANKEAKEKADADLAAERKSNAIKMELIGKVYNADITMS